MIFDAVMFLAETLKQFEPAHIDSPDSFGMIDCYDPTSTWSQGSTLLNFMKSVCQTQIGDFNISLQTIQNNISD